MPNDEILILPSETLASSVARIMSERGLDTHMWQEDGQWKVSPDFPTNISANQVRTFEASSKPLNNPPKPTSIKGITKYLNSLSKKEIKELASVDKIPLQSRYSLMIFIRDWRVDDPTHEEYIRSIAEGVSTAEGLRSGDLLNYLMVGGTELAQQAEDEYVPTTRWSDYIGKFLKNKPAGLDVKDLVGVHVAVLEMLPIKTYNHYTIAEIFADIPEMKDSLLGEPVLLAPIEFKALTALQTIVESGSIGQFKLALSKGSSKGIRNLANKRGGDIGGLILSAYKIATLAVGAFKIGDYRKAKDFMEELANEYGVGAGSFSAADEAMFIATLSSPRFISGDTPLEAKGNPQQVLLSFDTTFSTDSDKGATPAQVAMAARIVAQQAAWKYNGLKKAGTESGMGTNGYRTFVSEVSTGNNNRTTKKKGAIVSTDWLAIFWAILNAEKVVDEHLKPLANIADSNIYDEVFGVPGIVAPRRTAAAGPNWDFPALKAAYPSNKNKGLYDGRNIDKDKIKAYVNANKDDKDNERKWKEFDKNQTDYKGGGGSGKSGEWVKYKKDKPNMKEPMYRFIVHSDLQDENSTILGNMLPQGVLTVVVRPTESKGTNNFLPFEADMFYESYYEGDGLDDLIPTISQGDEEEEDINLADLSMSGRARRKARHSLSHSDLLEKNLDFQMGVDYEVAVDWAQALANRDGKSYAIYGDYTGGSNTSDGLDWFVTSKLGKWLDVGLPVHLYEEIKPQRTARKKSSSKKPSSGNMISIEVTPRSQVKLSTATHKADWIKKAIKEDGSGILKSLWNEYAKGDATKTVMSRGVVTGIKWRGKIYPFSDTEMKGGKSTNKKRRKQFPAALRTLMAKKGTYADYKKGQANMRMIYAKRIDNNKLVPFRINLPKILLRKRANKVIPKKGGHKEAVTLLLSKIEEAFGVIELDKRFETSGGYDTYKKDRETGEDRKDRDGKRMFDIPVDRGIHLLYKAQGLDTKGVYSTNAFPSGVRSGGSILYRAMTRDGKPVDLEVES